MLKKYLVYLSLILSAIEPTFCSNNDNETINNVDNETVTFSPSSQLVSFGGFAKEYGRIKVKAANIIDTKSINHQDPDYIAYNQGSVCTSIEFLFQLKCVLDGELGKNGIYAGGYFQTQTKNDSKIYVVPFPSFWKNVKSLLESYDKEKLEDQTKTDLPENISLKDAQESIFGVAGSNYSNKTNQMIAEKDNNPEIIKDLITKNDPEKVILLKSVNDLRLIKENTFLLDYNTVNKIPCFIRAEAYWFTPIIYKSGETTAVLADERISRFRSSLRQEQPSQFNKPPRVGCYLKTNSFYNSYISRCLWLQLYCLYESSQSKSFSSVPTHFNTQKNKSPENDSLKAKEKSDDTKTQLSDQQPNTPDANTITTTTNSQSESFRSNFDKHIPSIETVKKGAVITLGLAALTTTVYAALWYKGRGTSLPGMNRLFAPAFTKIATQTVDPALQKVASFFGKTIIDKNTEMAQQISVDNLTTAIAPLK